METLSRNKIKWIRSLRLKKNRDAENCFIVEGDKMVFEILNNHKGEVLCYVSTDPMSSETREQYICDDKAMSSISQLKTPSKHLVVVRKQEHKVTKPIISLLIDGVQDPGNMGTIIRTADWFGIDEIICSNETVDVYNSKVVQSTMGSLFRVPITYTDLSVYLNKDSRPKYGALLTGASISEMKFHKEAIIIVGNEGNGISSELEKLIDQAVLIPGYGEAESLNVAVATGILLQHYRQSLTS